jgi:hypothetical protein
MGPGAKEPTPIALQFETQLRLPYPSAIPAFHSGEWRDSRLFPWLLPKCDRLNSIGIVLPMSCRLMPVLKAVVSDGGG